MLRGYEGVFEAKESTYYSRNYKGYDGRGYRLLVGTTKDMMVEDTVCRW